MQIFFMSSIFLSYLWYRRQNSVANIFLAHVSDIGNESFFSFTVSGTRC